MECQPFGNPRFRKSSEKLGRNRVRWTVGYARPTGAHDASSVDVVSSLSILDVIALYFLCIASLFGR